MPKALVVEKEFKGEGGSRPQSKAGPRNQLQAHGLLGPEEAVDLCSPGKPDGPIARLGRRGDPQVLDVLLDFTPRPGRVPGEELH